ncbi:hypothetical protein PHYSODRAFT_475433 [Phytophthora sojae]|uniref:Uncharacterized protein n=1 Tax=Phytophthora sojae (strain P6497) TaxID=1094619 RepID=G4YPE3_PHYSP|nr:hypothetical protein PHYSODRAFT_475433 [Phytophthora sojae]EGZ27923.1 hypothetical protein PHYSODRAFT_475433 [Phytophthora sojae]|eukprot:XP_009515198.1 hypothetical protein PHYSODRAFT_475433 [Phytophthora sojae]
MEGYKKWSAKAALRSSLLIAETIAATGVVQDPFQQATSDRTTVDRVFCLLNVLFFRPLL